MPPRFVYWTIIFGGQPTSFRSATRDELLPTFKQIQSKHADAQLRYFARGKLWYSEDEARAALLRDRFEKSQRRRPDSRRPDSRRPGTGERPSGDRARPPGGGSRPPGDRPRPPGDRPRPPADRPRPSGDRPRSSGDRPRPPGDRTRPPGGGSWKPRAGSGKPEAGRRSDWRPGGEHKDPRAQFKVPRDVKRARMAKKFGWKKKKNDEKE